MSSCFLLKLQPSLSPHVDVHLKFKVKQASSFSTSLCSCRHLHAGLRMSWVALRQMLLGSTSGAWPCKPQNLHLRPMQVAWSYSSFYFHRPLFSCYKCLKLCLAAQGAAKRAFLHSVKSHLIIKIMKLVN